MMLEHLVSSRAATKLPYIVRSVLTEDFRVTSENIVIFESGVKKNKMMYQKLLQYEFWKKFNLIGNTKIMTPPVGQLYQTLQVFWKQHKV